MKFLNVEIPVKNLPELDQGFVPLGLFFKHHQMVAQKPLCIAVERYLEEYEQEHGEIPVEDGNKTAR